MTSWEGEVKGVWLYGYVPPEETVQKIKLVLPVNDISTPGPRDSKCH